MKFGTFGPSKLVSSAISTPTTPTTPSVNVVLSNVCEPMKYSQPVTLAASTYSLPTAGQIRLRCTTMYNASQKKSHPEF